MRRNIFPRAMVGAALVLLLTGPARAEGYGRQFGWGMATVGTNLIYIPAKLVYALAGGLTGSLAYALTVGTSDVTQMIWSVSLGGTYVVTPPMLRGEEPVLFFGESYRGAS